MKDQTSVKIKMVQNSSRRFLLPLLVRFRQQHPQKQQQQIKSNPATTMRPTANMPGSQIPSTATTESA